MRQRRHCVIVGGGPAGMMAGVLLARRGVEVTVLERHPDFLRDFRGDTIHPSTLRILDELGWLPELLALPHQKAATLHAELDGRQVAIADFSRLPVPARFIAFMPQWDFLDFLARKGGELPTFELRMGCSVAEFLRENGEIRGVRWRDAEGRTGEVVAALVIGADGRHSLVREMAGLEVIDFGSNVDVVWFKLSRQPQDPIPAMSHAGPQQGLVLIDRGDFWQCGYVIKKGSFADLKDAGLQAFHDALAQIAPLPASRFREISAWDQVNLLSIRMDRLKNWWRSGVLCIGDAAHAMSPVGGFGVNLAIQDAVAAANILARPLLEEKLADRHLAEVQARRLWPARATQKMQRMMRRKRKSDSSAPSRPPGFVRLIARFPVLSHAMGRLIGLGFRPERIK